MNPAKSFIIDLNKAVNSRDADDNTEYPGMPVIGHLSYAYREPGDNDDGENVYVVTINLGEMAAALNANWGDELYALDLESCEITETEATFLFGGSGVHPK